jgi:prophage regulatory protein
MRAKQKAERRGLTELTNGLLKIEDVLRFVPVSRATWFRGVKSGIFPQPVRLGVLTFWHTRDIRFLIEHQAQPKRRAARAATVNARA